MSARKNPELAIREVAAATDAVEQAENAIGALLAKLKRAPRVEKVTASAPLQAALDRLREARAILDDLSVKKANPGRTH